MTGSVHELADHTRVLVRPLRHSDQHELAVGYEHLSAEARRLRFFTAPARLSEADLEYLTNLDYHDHFAWAAFAVDEPGQPGIGVARYIRDAHHRDQAEVAVTVLDDYQRRGIGTLLLKMLAGEARRNGITTFVSHILWDNRELLETLAAAGARIEPEEPGVAWVALEIPAPESSTLVSLLRGVLRALGRTPREVLEQEGEARLQATTSGSGSHGRSRTDSGVDGRAEERGVGGAGHRGRRSGH
ncbi:MAG TPA: GNAT family N-acetyltransferase [Acidimicrobiales bacterium]|nr:GNAT family N-acetyltransferase [Acidimicrobiales bacterium]